jgi:hypothetical protein
MNSLLEKEEINPGLGGSIDMLFIYGLSFSSSKNGPYWAVTFQFGKWPKISDGQVFSSLENGPDWIVIFIMKMVLLAIFLVRGLECKGMS